MERAVHCRNCTKNSIRAKDLTHEDACKALLHFASFCNILLNFGSHNDGCKLPHHCHMSGWLSGKSSILQKLSEKSIGANPKGLCKAVLHFASFCNILLNFGSHNDGCKLPSSLPHEWLAEWKEQYIVETARRILFAQKTLLTKMHVKLSCILQVSAIYCSTLAAIMMAVSSLITAT